MKVALPPASDLHAPLPEARVTAPSMASQPTSIRLMGPTASQIYVDDHTAMALSAVWASVRVIADTMMVLPFEHQRRGDRGWETLLEGDTSRLVDVAANDEMPASGAQHIMQQWALLRGNGVAEIERSFSDRPIAWHPIEPWRVAFDRERGPAQRFVYDIANPGGPNTPLYVEDVIHIKGPARGDGMVGHSVVGLAREAIAMGLAAERFGASFFGNGLRPSGVLKHPETISPEALARLRDQWAERYSGSGNAGKPLILEEGMDWQGLPITPEDAQFLQTREFQVREIGPRWFGVPGFMLGDVEASKYANIEQLFILFVRSAAMPWAKRWEDEFNWKIVRRAGERVRVRIRDVMRGDIKTRAEFYKILFGIGALSPNDILELEEMLGVPGGDLRMVPMNMVPLHRAEELAGRKQDPAPQRGAPPGEGDREADDRLQAMSVSLAAVGLEPAVRKEAAIAEKQAAAGKLADAIAIEALYAEGSPIMRAVGEAAIGVAAAVAGGRLSAGERSAVGRVVQAWRDQSLRDLHAAESIEAIEAVCAGWRETKAREHAAMIVAAVMEVSDAESHGGGAVHAGS